MAKEVLTVRIDPKEVEALTAGAERRGMTRSAWLRFLIESRNEADRRPAA